MSTYVLGLTGQTGAGKSTVRNILHQRGFPVIDADTVARDVINDSKRCLADLALEFSIEILCSDGTLNRERLAAVAFSDKTKLKRLNAITFPHIVERIRELLIEMAKAGEPLVVLDAPTLFESGCHKLCSGVLSITAPEDERLNRILLRDRLTDTQARQRMNAQHKEDFYKEKSDFVIENIGDLDELKLKTFQILEQVEKSL